MDPKNRITSKGHERNGQAVPSNQKNSSPPQVQVEGESEEVERAALAAALGERFDRVNELWKLAEADLKRIPLPVDVSVGMEPFYEDHLAEAEGRPYGARLLGFAQSKGGWRICCGVEYFQHDDGDPGWLPISECPLDLRISAIKHLKPLQKAVHEAAKKSILTLDMAIVDLEITLGLAK